MTWHNKPKRCVRTLRSRVYTIEINTRYSIIPVRVLYDLTEDVYHSGWKYKDRLDVNMRTSRSYHFRPERYPLLTGAKSDTSYLVRYAITSCGTHRCGCV